MTTEIFTCIILLSSTSSSFLCSLFICFNILLSSESSSNFLCPLYNFLMCLNMVTDFCYTFFNIPQETSVCTVNIQASRFVPGCTLASEVNTFNIYLRSPMYHSRDKCHEEHFVIYLLFPVETFMFVLSRDVKLKPIRPQLHQLFPSKVPSHFCQML